MTARQIGAVAMCALINAIDGFDVQVAAFAGPSIATELTLSPEALGLFLSAGLIGMGIGALLLSSLADLLGRRPTALGCLLLVTAGMAASAMCRSVETLVATRLLTGIGIGGVISSVGALATEYASDRRRGLVIGFMAISFPAGAMVCALSSLALIESVGWRAVFVVGAIATLAVLPLAFWLLPESIVFVLFSRRPGALDRANRLLNRFDLPSVSILPQSTPGTAPAFMSKVKDVLTGRLGARTLRLTLIFLFAMLSFYFLLSWAPRLVVMTGAPLQSGLTVGLLINVGGMAGGVLAGLAIPRLGLVFAGRVALVAMTICACSFGLGFGSFAFTAALAVGAGVTMWAVQTCIYTLMMLAFPSRVRATAIGFVSTGGRVGSVLGPLLGGVVLGRGASPEVACLILGLPALGAALLLAEQKAEEN